MNKSISNIVIKILTNKNLISNEETDISIKNIDSMTLIEIIICCEESFNFEFDYSELNLSNFETVSSITTLIEAHLNGFKEKQ